MQETVLATPPRAWGRLSTLCHPGRGQGNTPTSVGKTVPAGLDGDDAMETPPRAWGRPRQQVAFSHVLGNTPTSVGKTPDQAAAASPAGKHPHERGEDVGSRPGTASPSETPPRAWGRPGPAILRPVL